jgi:hypothetical protein
VLHAPECFLNGAPVLNRFLHPHILLLRECRRVLSGTPALATELSGTGFGRFGTGGRPLVPAGGSRLDADHQGGRRHERAPPRHRGQPQVLPAPHGTTPGLWVPDHEGAGPVFIGQRSDPQDSPSHVVHARCALIPSAILVCPQMPFIVSRTAGVRLASISGATWAPLFGGCP